METFTISKRYDETPQSMSILDADEWWGLDGLDLEEDVYTSDELGAVLASRLDSARIKDCIAIA